MLPSEIIGAESTTSVTEEAQQRNELGQEDFLRMLIAQLEHQDPLNPQDSTEFTAQLAQFSSLEQLIAMRAGIDELGTTLGTQSAEGAADPTRDLLAAGVIGQEIVARGSQFQLEGSGDEIHLAFDLYGNTSDTVVRIRNQGGDQVHAIPLGRLSQGRYEVVWDGQREGGGSLPSGVYSYEVDAALGGEPVASERFIGGRVTGTSLGSGDPLLQLGDVIVPWSDVVEIREPRPGS